ncbi:MAG: trehalose-phosphatase [marine benthic group bacterium]|nr:trehalose-phosphatase [Candidatus Benthicola marisminoris]
MRSDLDGALRRLGRSKVLLVAADFDGTLSPIVSDPSAAAPDPRALEPLIGLAALPSTSVLVISGRARADVEKRLGPRIPGIDIIGSHGAEPGADEGLDVHPDIEVFAARLAPVVHHHPGSELEVKPFSVAFHLRNVSVKGQIRAGREAIECVGPIAAQVKKGKKVLEFMAVSADKGQALEAYRAARGASATFFVGDDVTDEAVFEVLGPGDVGVKVGPGPTAAHYRVEGQPDVAGLLTELLHQRDTHTRG